MVCNLSLGHVNSNPDIGTLYVKSLSVEVAALEMVKPGKRAGNGAAHGFGAPSPYAIPESPAATSQVDPVTQAPPPRSRSTNGPGPTPSSPVSLSPPPPPPAHVPSLFPSAPFPVPESCAGFHALSVSFWDVAHVLFCMLARPALVGRHMFSIDR